MQYLDIVLSRIKHITSNLIQLFTLHDVVLEQTKTLN